MKIETRSALVPLLTLAASLALGSAVLADDHDHSTPATQPAAGRLVEPTDADAAWLAKARVGYPLKACVVSHEEFGGAMGAAIDRIYREPGQPDRLIRFCCKDCLDDFNQSPAKYLKAIDDATAKKAKHK